MLFKAFIVLTPYQSLLSARSRLCSLLLLSQFDHCKDPLPVLFVRVYSVVRKCCSYTCSTSGLLHRQVYQTSPSWSVLMTLRKKNKMLLLTDIWIVKSLKYKALTIHQFFINMRWKTRSVSDSKFLYLFNKNICRMVSILQIE